jgi:transposase
MSKAQLVITAVVIEGRSKSEVARDYGLSRYWVHQLVCRYQAEGAAAFEPRSRRKHHHRHAVTAEVEDKIVRLRSPRRPRAARPVQSPRPGTLVVWLVVAPQLARR